uniref:Uncharacterized protein n=1 Tax=Brassica oleracea var. oleracea TaxID=109376 RepID=A0A0D3BZ54_BRAOL
MGCGCCCCFPILASNLYTAAPLQNMILTTRSCSLNAATTFISRAFLNGWKEARLVQSVTRKQQGY